MTQLNKTPVTIRARRGTDAQITASSPAPYQKQGELAYSTDTGQLYISNGTQFLRIITENSDNNSGFGTTNPKTKIHNTGAYTQEALSTDPINPDEGYSVQWISDGTGSGDAGDVMMKITAGGITKTATLLDFSAI